MKCELCKRESMFEYKLPKPTLADVLEKEEIAYLRDQLQCLSEYAHIEDDVRILNNLISKFEKEGGK